MGASPASVPEPTPNKGLEPTPNSFGRGARPHGSARKPCESEPWSFSPHPPEASGTVTFRRHETSLEGKQARREAESPHQEAHVAEVSEGKTVFVEPECPSVNGRTTRRRAMRGNARLTRPIEMTNGVVGVQRHVAEA